MNKDLYIGIDFATENVRAVAIDKSGAAHAQASAPLAKVIAGDDKRLTQDVRSWIGAVSKVLSEIAKILTEKQLSAVSLCISATSGTFVITNERGEPIADAAMYNDGRATSVLGRAEKIIAQANQPGPFLLANTPEFVISYLSSTPLAQIATDSSHSLKIGVDLENISYSPAALSTAQGLNIKLPKLELPGSKLATLSKEIADQLGLDQIPIYAGMTDGCTAQISAAGANGSVTSLGTTMVIKAVSIKNISGPAFYSHLLPRDRYLAGGASNIGGISYKEFASDIDNWNQKATDFGVANMVCYPLPAVGERFPFLSTQMPKLESNLASGEVERYRAILEAIAFTEKYAYDLLEKAGASISSQIFTVGGGGKSNLLSQIRATVMNKQVVIMAKSGSDIGAAMLAYASHNAQDNDLAKALSEINIAQTNIFTPQDDQRAELARNYQSFLELTAKYKG